MLRRVTMAAFASDAAVEKRQTFEVVARPRILALYAAHVTTHAASRHGQCGRHGRQGPEAGLHIIRFQVGVVGNRRLQKIPVYRVKIRDAQMPGAEEIVELLASLY